MLIDTKNSPYANVWSLPCKAVMWRTGFWEDTLMMCTEHTVPQLQRMFDSKDISHVVENFKICAGESTGSHAGTPFGDGDFYKWMEAAMYTAAYRHNQDLFDQLDGYIALLGKAQLPDGYLSTKQIIGERTQNGVARLGDVNDFEVYNFGHLFTAASLHKRLTGKDNFLRIAIKAADYLECLYQKASETGEVQTAVCPSHYMGLVEMYRTTADERYLKLAKTAMKLRDCVSAGTDDNQDRIPLLEQDQIVGHAVRANYLYAGAADLYAETGDPAYLSMLHKVWNSLITHKIYITGGCGALYNGVSPYGNFFKDQKTHQAYGYEYQLPNITAYNETCASIGGVMWADRMFHIEPKACYMDLLERMMLNVNLAAVSLDGKKFFYENMLRRAKKLEYELVWPLERSEYIKSYCCPPNLARVMAQSAEYAYCLDEDTVWTGLYGDNIGNITLPCGAAFTIHQETDYPYDGKIKFTFDRVSDPTPWNLKVRIPGWAESGSICVNGKTEILTGQASETYQTIRVTNTKETVIELVLDMPVRLTAANAMVEEDSNQVAVERGPLVYCMESPDAPVETLDDLLLPIHAEFTLCPYEIAGRKMTALKTQLSCLILEESDRGTLYRTVHHQGMKQVDVRLIPYFAWDNRGFGEMRIWFPAAYPI
ncbi:MAG: glycoside hydrolase family 127 protein [Hungatella sp.]